MLYDLNFWQTPDWRRESSLDPRFLAVVLCCLVLVGLLGLLSWRYRQFVTLGAQIAVIQAKCDKVESTAAEVNRQRACIRNWQRVLRGLDHKRRVRLLWCRQLAALQRLIPDSLIFSSVGFSSQQTEIVPENAKKDKSGRPKRIPVIVGELTLRGIALGPTASEDIAWLSRNIERDPILGPLLESARLDTVASATDDLKTGAVQKSFTIFCTYKPIRWFDVPKK